MRGPWEFENAPCSEVGVSIFFMQDKDDPQSNGTTDQLYREAKSVCNRCQYKTDCAMWGIQNETHGVWGGLTPKERKALRRKGNIPLTSNPALLFRVE